MENQWICVWVGWGRRCVCVARGGWRVRPGRRGGRRWWWGGCVHASMRMHMPPDAAGAEPRRRCIAAAGPSQHRPPPRPSRPAGHEPARTHLVLEEVEVEVALEAAHKGDRHRLPLHLVGEGEGGTRGERLRRLAGQVDVDDLRGRGRGGVCVCVCGGVGQRPAGGAALRMPFWDSMAALEQHGSDPGMPAGAGTPRRMQAGRHGLHPHTPQPQPLAVTEPASQPRAPAPFPAHTRSPLYAMSKVLCV